MHLGVLGLLPGTEGTVGHCLVLGVIRSNKGYRGVLWGTVGFVC